MIQSKKDYKLYLKEDRISLGIQAGGFKSQLKELVAPHVIWKFQKTLRKLEYYHNCKKDIFSKIYTLYLRYKFRKISLKLGFSIPINIFGPGLAIVHYGTIVINARTKVGKNCRMHACVNIGASGGQSEAPILGDNVYIAPGAKIYGNIKINNNIAIGANAVVNKSFEEDNILIAGNPAKKIKEIDITKIIKRLAKDK